MKKIFSLQTLELLLRLGLAAVFIVASLYKIRAPEEFAHQIYNYRILPPGAINPTANLLPWLQLLCGAALLWRPLAQGGSLCLVAFMVVFQVALASALIRGLNISCGCFKSGGEAANWLTFGRDTTILLVSMWVAWRLNRKAAG